MVTDDFYFLEISNECLAPSRQIFTDALDGEYFKCCWNRMTFINERMSH